MNRVLAICSLFIFLFSFTAFSANGTVKGVVVDSYSKKPLSAVNITVTGEETGTATNENGEFVLTLPAGFCTLQASSIGYETTNIPNLKIKSEVQKSVTIELNSSVIEMEQVIVTATREKSLLRDVPVSASIISAKDIEERNPLTVGEALQSTNSTMISQYGVVGATESISLRGSSSTQVLVLWDGQRINSALSGMYDLGTIPIQSIERIETVHGSYSSLYGADAMGGVVNLITRIPSAGEGLKGSFNSSFGSFGLQNYAINLNQNLGRWSYFVTANTAESKGNFDYNPYEIGIKDQSETVRRENSRYTAKSVFGKVTGQLSPTTTLTALGEWSNIDRGVPGSLSFPTVNGFQADKTNRVHVNVESAPRSFLRFKFGSHYHTHQLSYKDENPYFPTNSTNTAEAYGSNLQGTFIFASQKVLFGSSYLHEAGDGTDVGRPERNNLGLFTQGEFRVTPFSNKMYSASVLPSVRYDYYTDFENAVNPRVGVLLAKAGEYSYGIRASWGKSFHAPTFNDLYWIGDAYTAGNPDLKPETATSYDTGLRSSLPLLGGIEFEIGYFSKDANDLIQWAGDLQTGKWKPQNVSSAQVTGEELKLALPRLLERFSTELNYTHQNAVNSSGMDDVDGKYLIYRPEDKTSSISSVSLGPALLTFAATYIGERYADEMNLQKLDSVWLMDTNLGFKTSLLDYKLDIVLSLKNMMDKQYQFIYDYPMPGRMWRIKVGLGI